MKINDKELPPEILEYFKQSIDDMSDKELIDMSKAISSNPINTYPQINTANYY